MEIIVGKTAGFCYGVRNAVTKAEEKLKEHGKVDCLGELVHNGEVIKKLEGLGMTVVENIEDAKEKVIVRAHGIEKSTYEKAKELNIEIFDFTCPSVLKIHEMADEYRQKGYFIFCIGGKKHPETLGTISFCGEKSCLLENEEDMEEALEKFSKSGIKKLCIIVQTTFSMEKFNKMVEDIKDTLSDDIELEIKNTICNATKIRQDETAEISKNVDCMIIIGGKNSSNTRKLYDIAKANCDNIYLIETKNELPIEDVIKSEKIGIMAGASTPDESIQDVIGLIEKSSQI